MATIFEKNRIIQNLFGAEYSLTDVSGTLGITNAASDLWSALASQRTSLINELNNEARYYSSTLRENLPPDRGTVRQANMSIPRAAALPSAAVAGTRHASSYKRAVQSYVWIRLDRSQISSPTEEQLAPLYQAGQETTNVPQVTSLRDEIRNKFTELIQQADLGSVANSEYANGFQRVVSWVRASGGGHAETASEDGILSRAEDNYIWAYYHNFIAAERTAPAESFASTVEDFIGLDSIVRLFVRVRVRILLLESIDALPEEQQEVLEDPDQVGTAQYEEARAALRTEANRRAQEEYVDDEDRGSPENQAKLRRLAEQSFLIDFLPEFAEQNQQIRAPSYLNSDGVPYFNMVHGQTDTIVNRLLYNPALQNMDILRPSEISSLVPKVRLFKVFYDSEADFNANQGDSNQKTYIEQEVPFDNYMQPSEVESMLTNAFDRGRGVGLTSFDWRMEGRDPFTARRDIFAELKLHFQSFDELLRERSLRTSDLNESKTFRYVDLVNIGIVRRTSTGAWNPDYYKLRVEVGWQDPGPNSSFLGDAATRQAKRDAVLNSKMVLYLTATDHDIDINDQGNVNMSVQYVAWQEASYLDQDSDVLATEQIKQLRLQRRAQIEEARANCNEERVEQVIQEFKTTLRQERYESYKKILDKLYLERRIFYVPVPVADLESYINFGESGVNTRAINDIFNNRNNTSAAANIDFANSVSINDRDSTLASVLGMNVGSLEDGDILKRIQEMSYDASGANANVQYFYFGDLIKVALEQVSDSTSARAGSNPSAGMVGKLEKDLRILMGPISFKRTLAPARGTGATQTQFVYNINLADIPISVNFYSEWFLKQVVSEQRNTYPILVFIRDLANRLLTGILKNQSHGLTNVARQNLQIRSNFFTAAASATGGDIVQENFNTILNPRARLRQQLGFDTPQQFTRLDLDAATGLPEPLMRPPNDNEKSYHYMLIYAINAGSTQDLQGNYSEDRRRGIYHFGIGKDRGIFKTVKFSKTDLPFLRESRFSQDAEAAATGLTILANVYEIEMKMVGNTIFAPGMKLYLNPSGLAPMLGSPTARLSPASLLGIGGYHVVIGVQSYIESGVYETTVKAIWEASGARGAIGFTGPEAQTQGESECSTAVEAQNIITSPTTTTQTINTGPRGND